MRSSNPRNLSSCTIPEKGMFASESPLRIRQAACEGGPYRRCRAYPRSDFEARTPDDQWQPHPPPQQDPPPLEELPEEEDWLPLPAVAKTESWIVAFLLAHLGQEIS